MVDQDIDAVAAQRVALRPLHRRHRLRGARLLLREELRRIGNHILLNCIEVSDDFRQVRVCLAQLIDQRAYSQARHLAAQLAQPLAHPTLPSRHLS